MTEIGRRTGSAKSYLDIIPATRDIPERLDNRLSLSGPPGRRYTTHSDRRLNMFVLPPQARRLNNRLSLSGPPGRDIPLRQEASSVWSSIRFFIPCHWCYVRCGRTVAFVFSTN